jgi:hypothetical protein
MVFELNFWLCALLTFRRGVGLSKMLEIVSESHAMLRLDLAVWSKARLKAQLTCPVRTSHPRGRRLTDF